MATDLKHIYALLLFNFEIRTIRLSHAAHLFRVQVSVPKEVYIGRPYRASISGSVTSIAVAEAPLDRAVTMDGRKYEQT